MSTDLGGDPPCWAHLIDEDADTTAGEGTGAVAEAGVVVDLGSTDTRGRAGVVWSLPHGGDLDANLVHLDPGATIGSHVNDEVDVVITVIAGRGHVIIDDTTHPLRGDVLALIPKGARREIRAGAQGITYLSMHRRRRPLGITPKDRPRMTTDMRSLELTSE